MKKLPSNQLVLLHIRAYYEKDGFRTLTKMQTVGNSAFELAEMIALMTGILIFIPLSLPPTPFRVGDRDKGEGK